MSRVRQVARRVDVECVAGNPLTLTVNPSGATLSSPAVTVSQAGAVVATNTPDVTMVSGDIQAVWTTGDTSGLFAAATGRTSIAYDYSVRALVNGQGPFELVAGRFIVHRVGTADVSTSSTAVDITVGGAVVNLDVQVGASAADHIADPTAAHAASAISVLDSGNNWVGDDVEAVFADVARRTLRQLSPTSLGAVDDGPALNAFFAGAGRMFLPPGTYTVVTPLVMVSNSQLFARGVTLVNNSTGGSTRFLTIEGRSNVRIEGLTLNGNKAAFAPATEQRHGIFCRSSTNVEFVDVTSNDNKGDGFYFGGDNVSNKCSIVRLHNCIGSGNHRMGLTLISVEDFHDVGGWYGNSSGTSPQAGCDIEPNVEGDTNARITFTGTSFVNNVWDGVRISPKATPTAKQAGVTFDGCWFDNNGRYGLVFYNARQIQINGGSVSGNADRGVYNEGGYNEDITFSGTVIAGNGEEGFDLDSPFRNFTLIGCTVVNNNTVGGTNDAIDALPISASSGLTIIGGRISGAAHRFGVRTGGNVSNLTIIGTDLSGNGSGPMSLADDVATRRLMIANDRLFTSRADVTTEMVFGTRGAGDIADRFSVRGDGTLLWGSGAASADCRIDRVAANTLAIGGGDAFRLGTTTTAARPSAATVGAGAAMWDTTLNKMIVSNGSAWEVVTSV